MKENLLISGCTSLAAAVVMAILAVPISVCILTFALAFSGGMVWCKFVDSRRKK